MMIRIDDDNRKWWILASLSGVLGMIVLDETVVGVALPTIRNDLGMSQVGSHWVVDSYLLVFTSLAAAGGRLGDLIDMKRVFIAGLAVFGIASLAAGLSEDGTAIITARGIQGIGAAIIFPTSVAMITQVFPAEQRGLAFRIQTMTGGTFISLGPLVGGFFTEVISWRWVFWINLPFVVVIAFIMSVAWLTPPRQGRSPRPDLPGLITLVLGLGALVLGIMQGAVWGWSAAATVVLLAGGTVMILVFAVVESRVSEPLVEVTLFRNATITGSNLVIFAGQFSKIAIVVFGALYLQDVLHMSPLRAGVALLAAVVPTAFTSLLAGRLADRFGARWLSLGGLLLNASAVLSIGFAVSWESYELLVPPLVIWGATLPFLYVPTRRAVVNAVPMEKHGQASGITLSAQLLGGTIGMAVCGAVLASTGDFRLVFLVTGGMSVAVLVTGLLFIERDSSTTPPRHT
jgi:EmrB/QacA subfamily drug resistance transporter